MAPGWLAPSWATGGANVVTFCSVGTLGLPVAVAIAAAVACSVALPDAAVVEDDGVDLLPPQAAKIKLPARINEMKGETRINNPVERDRIPCSFR